MREIGSDKNEIKKMTKGSSIIQNMYMKCVQYKQEERITCNEIKLILNNELESVDFVDKYLLDEKYKFNHTQTINFIFEKKLYQQRNKSLNFYCNENKRISFDFGIFRCYL